ncbi:hypothetical protein BCV70DRAFT_15866 [Testicularia cyperi]|uniref:Uncharacterized protein n=1 Tax=Testicularia cyperi TaxID=1882483 RepID=A0A317XYK6_9BASI|nr:hypothetical protein BCV70DRAFT_15866 [Testicularia cyperi]
MSDSIQDPTSATEGEKDVQDVVEAVDDGFHDFEDPQTESADADGNNDDFGDFDDFEEGGAAEAADFGDDGGFGDNDEFGQEVSASAIPEEPPSASTPIAPQRTWSTLNVTRSSKRHELCNDIVQLLPLSQAAEAELTTEGLRQVEGHAQVLISGTSRQLWSDVSSFPSIKPIDWVRSKTRRDYLISMGIPVNLDEIHSTFASGSRGPSSQLPPLKLKLDSSVPRASGPGSAPADGNGLQRSSSLRASTLSSSSGSSAVQRSASTSNSPRNGSSSPALGSSTNSRERMAERRREELGLGPPPVVDLKRAEELVGKTEDQLTLMSLPALRSMQRELNTLTTSTSSLLTHHLTLRESYQADSEMYNSMIKELVTGAASRMSASSGSSSSRNDPRRATTIGVSSTAKRTSAQNASPSGVGRAMSPSLRGGAATSPRR